MVRKIFLLFIMLYNKITNTIKEDEITYYDNNKKNVKSIIKFNENDTVSTLTVYYENGEIQLISDAMRKIHL
tara:strand:- start:456 stop:671 length:216 start_codon:yes stop_codon:yes gene_type:complete